MILQGNDPTTGASFTLGNRLQRQLWQCVWLCLFRPSPRPLHAWRATLLRLFGARLGPHVHIYPDVKIWAPWQLSVGGHSGVADGVTLYNMAPIEIGAHCVVSQGAHLCTGSHDYNSANFQLVAHPIVLASHVWICAEAFVSPGVSLAEGAVVAPRAVVTRSLRAPWTVYAGVPARPISTRTRHGTAPA
ncbi:acetyltransferase [Cupriavidus basilensis]|uniref:acetyltransferase n=1 Tax=Cupriavidus basilensis TaxID=68895 RepID=UPI000750C71A|nr:acetyltransferase [Cupriavidus basilensis]